MAKRRLIALSTKSASYVPLYIRSSGYAGQPLSLGSSQASNAGNAVVWAHDGSWLAVAKNNNPGVIVYETTGFSILVSLSVVSESAYDIALSPDGSKLAVLGSSKLYVVDTTTWGAVTTNLPSTTSSGKLLFTLDGAFIVAITTGSPYIARYDATTLSRVNLGGNGYSPTTNTLSISPDGSMIVYGWSNVSSNLFVQTYDPVEGTFTLSTPYVLGNIHCTAFSSSLPHLALGRNSTTSPTLRIVNTETWTTVKTITHNYCRGLKYSNNGRYLAAFGSGGWALYDAYNDYALVKATGYTTNTNPRIAFSPDDSRVVFGSDTTSTTVEYDIATDTLTTIWTIATGDVQYSPIELGGEISNENTDPVRDASGMPVAREVWVMNRDSGTRIASTTSDPDTGRYSFFLLDSSTPRMVIFRADNDMENSAVIDWVYPE